MTGRRETLELGVFGRVPSDSLFELYLDLTNGDMLTFYQTRHCASLGGWVYEAAACLALYMHSDDFRRRFATDDDNNRTPTSNRPSTNSISGPAASPPPRPSPLRGRRVVELGAGTGIVGIYVAAQCGASSVVTDLESLVPLMAYNVEKNQAAITAAGGSARAAALCWGDPAPVDLLAPDFLVLANCVYYESSLEVLLETILALTDRATAPTVVLACYEERTKEISGLIGRWHDLLRTYFDIEDVRSELLDPKFKRDYVRVCILKSRSK